MRRALVLAVVGAGAAYVAYGIYSAGLNELPPPPVNSQIVFRTGKAYGERIDARSWSADYESVVSNADQTQFDLSGVRNGIIFRHGKPFLHVTAAHLSTNMLTKDFTATGPLRVETIAGTPQRTFETTSAIWNDGMQTLTFPQPITVRTVGDKPLRMGSLSLSVKTGEIEMSDVDGPIRIK